MSRPLLSIGAATLYFASQVEHVPIAINDLGDLGIFLIGAGAMGWIALKVWTLVKGGGRVENGALTKFGAALQAMDRALEQQVVQQAATTTALAGLVLLVTRLTDRLEHLPTKLDLNEAHRETRHDWRNALNVVSGVLQAELKELQRK